MRASPRSTTPSPAAAPSRRRTPSRRSTPTSGVAKVPDDRLVKLAEMSSSKSVVPASVQFVDIAGLVEGAAQGEGLGNRFLAHIREVDAIVFVLRAFVDIDVPGSSDPVEQLSTLEVELVYADLETLEKQSEKRRKAARVDKSLADEVAAMDAAIDGAAGGDAASTGRPGPGGRASSWAATSCSPTSRPWRWSTSTRNSSRTPSPCWPRCARPSATSAGPGHGAVHPARGRGSDARRGLRAPRCSRRSGWARVRCPTSCAPPTEMLGLRTFLTTGEKESRAWTFRAGSKAPQAAGVIHTDFERGFIRAEVIQADELLEIGLVVQGPRRRQAARRGQGLRGRGRRRRRVPLQRLSVWTRAGGGGPTGGLRTDGWLVHRGRCSRAPRSPAPEPNAAEGCSVVTRSTASCVLPVRSVHTMGMRFGIDVAFCDGDGLVLRLVTMAPWHPGRVCWAARQVIEAPERSFASWGVDVGDVLEVRT